VDGHLPIGTYLCRLEEMEEFFVESEPFIESTTRRLIFDGFIGYLYEWERVEQQLGVRILKRIWVGGSFTSGEIEVGDIRFRDACRQ
jgi:hypothetical protein